MYLFLKNITYNNITNIISRLKNVKASAFFIGLSVPWPHKYFISFFYWRTNKIDLMGNLTAFVSQNTDIISKMNGEWE